MILLLDYVIDQYFLLSPFIRKKEKKTIIELLKYFLKIVSGGVPM